VLHTFQEVTGTEIETPNLKPADPPVKEGKKKGASKRKADDEAGPGKKPRKEGKEGEEEAAAITSAEYREKHGISIMQGDALSPFQTFAKAPFSEPVMNEINKAGFGAPTPIQSQCWPFALAGKDIVAVAKTGSGKTCGYLMPCIALIQQRCNPRKSEWGAHPLALFIAPTRELAQQIHVECEKFGNSSGLYTAVLYGGIPQGHSIKQCRDGMHICVATPGRLKDMVESGHTGLKNIFYLTLDEADMMLDMGFIPVITELIAKIPSERQTLMFTATWPKQVQNIAKQFLKDPVQINIGLDLSQSKMGDLVVNPDVGQTFFKLEASEKTDKLCSMIKDLETSGKDWRAMVFMNRKVACNYAAEDIKRFANVGAVAIHGDMDQWSREKALNWFKKGGAKVIVATDVASRGLDIKGVSHVFNYDFPPPGVEPWVHRVGRTGRAGVKGEAITFLEPDEVNKKISFVLQLVDILDRAKKDVPDFLRRVSDANQWRKQQFREQGWGSWNGGGG